MLLVEAAVLDRGGRNRGIGVQNPANFRDGTPQVTAFQAGLDGNVLPAVLAPKFELARFLDDIHDLGEFHQGTRRGPKREFANPREGREPRRIDLDPDFHDPIAFQHR